MKSLVFLTVSMLLNVSSALSEDAESNFLELARKYGFNADEYDVQTKDGYILKLFHIPGDRSRTVLLIHGVLNTADTFIWRGKTSLAASLVTRGYDVWIGNNRGNKYTRRHLRLKPEDDAFWDFSLHEMAIYDLPALIDFILTHNRVPRLSLIGHSLGNMQFYVLGAMRPEYNEKVKVALALGPAGYLNVDNFKYWMSTVVTLVPFINELITDSGQAEIYGDMSFLISFRDRVCAHKVLGYEICGSLVMAFTGEDLEEFEREFYYFVIKHFPCSTSRKLAMHLYQIAQRKLFASYDYGIQNLDVNETTSQTNYDLSKVTMKVAMFVGANDQITNLKNVALLRDNLPNVVSYHVMERKKFNHLDFIWGRHMHKYLFPHIFRILDKYGLDNSTSSYNFHN